MTTSTTDTPPAPPKKRRRRFFKPLERWAGYLFIRLLQGTMSAFPARVTSLVGGWLGPVTYRVGRGWRRVALANLAKIYPEMPEAERVALARRCFTHFAKAGAEFLRLPRMSEAELDRRTHIEGIEHLEAGLARGKGVILVSAHFGNWEFVGAALMQRGFEVDAIARNPELKQTADLLQKTRESRSMHRVYPRGNVLAAVHGLKENRILLILADQHDFSGVRIDFLGHACLAAQGPASIALMTGCAIVPVFSYRRPDDTFDIRLFPALDVARTGNKREDILNLTQQINDVIGVHVQQRPDMWLWFHERWRPHGRGPAPVEPADTTRA